MVARRHYHDVEIHVYADVFQTDREKLTEIESEKLGTLLKELTQLYGDLEIETNLTYTHIPIEDVPEEYYDEDELEDEHNFIQIEF